MPKALISSVTPFTSLIIFAFGLTLGFASNNPSTSDNINNKSASSSLATRADNLSLSAKQTWTELNISSKSITDTVSFWLIIGTAPISNNLFKVVLRLKYFFLWEKSSSVSKICAATTLYVSKPSSYKDINLLCPIAAQACFKATPSVFDKPIFFLPSPTAPDVTRITSFPDFTNFEISSI